MLKISQTIQPPQQTQQKPQFNVDAAVEYNTRSEAYFKDYEDDIKRVIGSSAVWASSEFAQAVYDWQQKNGFVDKWVDGKFGPRTMAKVAKLDSTLASKYDPYAAFKKIHNPNQSAPKKVIALMPEIERIRNEMGANDIPMSMLVGWVSVESGGNINSRGLPSLDERGLFQLSKDESAELGLDHDKVGSDIDYSIRAGIQLAKKYAEKIDALLVKYPKAQGFFVKNSDMYWRLVFFAFSAGYGTAERLVGNMIDSGETFANWNDVMRFAGADPHGYKHSPQKWSFHVMRAWNIGDNSVSPTKQASYRLQTRIKQAKRKARLVVLFGDE